MAALRGEGVECPVCGAHLRRFLTAHGALAVRKPASTSGASALHFESDGRYGGFRALVGPYELVLGPSRPNAICPSCMSQERHRRIFLLLRRELGGDGERVRLLHVAAEPAIRREIERFANLDYIVADRYNLVDVDVAADLTAMGFATGAFDAVICSHVLEHVDDDDAAMREIRRVLAPEGWAILDVPINSSLDQTFEDWSVTSLADRRRVFGQEDHVRIYGTNFPDLVRKSGFDVDTDPLELPARDEARFACRGDADFDSTCFCRPANEPASANQV